MSRSLRIPSFSAFSGRDLSIPILLLVYRILLDVSYIDLVATVYHHNDYEMGGSLGQCVESYLFLFLVFLFLPKGQDRFSKIALQLLFVIGFVPISSFFGVGEGDRLWFYACNGFFLILSSLTSLLNRECSDLPVGGNRRFTEYELGSVLFLLPLLTILAAGYFNGFFLNLDLLSIYGIREQFEGVQDKIPFGGYFMNWAGKVAMPFLFLVTIFGRSGVRYFHLLLLGVFLLLLFSLAGHKSYLFIPFLAVGVGILIRRRAFLRELIGVMVLVIVACLLVFQLGGDSLPGSIFIRRFFFAPAKLSWYYHELFTKDLLFLSHSVLEGVTQYPLEMNNSLYVAREFLGENMNANNGIFSDGLKNFGLLGLYFWAILLAALLKVCDRLTAGKDSIVLWSLLAVGGYTFINGALFPTLLTHGFFLSLLLAFIYPMKRSYGR
ncbi:MAG: hypothetical protein ABEH38_06155 [Flavobacteriales bacterium]